MNDTERADIVVYDAIMGAGKTSMFIDRMNEASEDKRFIYITPFLAEVERVKNTVKKRTFHEPCTDNAAGRKMADLKRLLTNGADIVSTHALFREADAEVLELLRTDGGYTLVLDEVMDVVEPVNARPDDVRRLIQSGDIEMTDKYRVKWTGAEWDNSRYRDIRLMAQAGNLYLHRDRFLCWAFNEELFEAMEAVEVLTYLFHGSMLRHYFDLHGIVYRMKSVRYSEAAGKYAAVDYDPKAEPRQELRELITVYEGKLNDIGARKNALSATWLRGADVERLRELQKNTYNFLHNIAKVNQSEAYWSSLKELENTIRPRRYKSANIPLNARATNEHQHKRACAYLFNRYNHPYLNAFFQDNGVKVNDEALAAAELLQWIWRSRIRNGEPIHLYLPSSRMRAILEDWAAHLI